MHRRFDVVIFDLDGTLLDTLEAIADAANSAMRLLGLPMRPLNDYRFLAGQGLPHLIEGLLGPEHIARFDQAITAHRAGYDARGDALTHVFPGITDTLTTLRHAGCKLAVLSNKPHAMTVRAVERFFQPGTFDVVLGHRDGHAPKPDPAGALEVLTALHATPSRTAYVGDTDVDMQTGRSAGLHTVGVLWGFRDRAELLQHGAHVLVDQPSQIVPIVLGA